MQLGNGGGFDFNSVSSSFIVRHEGHYVLVDCGFNVLNKLKSISLEDEIDYLKNIHTVCITHHHEDHIGNLMSLVYYRYFTYGLQTTIMAGEETTRDWLRNYLSPCQSELKSGLVVLAEMARIVRVSGIYGCLSIQALPANHAVIASCGYSFTPIAPAKFPERLVAITGDTKAYYKLEEKLGYLVENEGTDLTIFHDYSNWDNVSSNVHACATDIGTEYSEEFRKALTFYHDNKPFTRQWL